MALRGTEESEGPYPWQGVFSKSAAFQVQTKRCHDGAPKLRTVRSRGHETPSSLNGDPADKVNKWLACLHPSLMSTPSLKDMFLEAVSKGCIDFRLPPVSATSGIALGSAVRVIENLFDKWYPMIFKIGYTHNVVHRWSNATYGYCSQRDKWTNMCVLFISHEPHGPAMLEAALVEKYQSTLSTYFMVHGPVVLFNVYVFRSNMVRMIARWTRLLVQTDPSKAKLAAGMSGQEGKASVWKHQTGMPICAISCIDLSNTNLFRRCHSFEFTRSAHVLSTQ